MEDGSIRFSVIVPTYNRPRQLTDCLAALAALDYPADRFEVIVLDDGGDRPLEEIVARYREKMRVTLLRQPNAGPAAARNAGAAKARGRFLAFTDDDCAPARDWLRTFEARLAAANDPIIVGGRVVNVLTENLFATASQLIVDVGCAYHNGDAERARFCTANNFAVPTEHFRAIGGFDGNFRIAASEDREFCGRWLHRGYRIAYAPDVLVHHAHELTWRSFLRQHFTYGRGALLLQKIRSREQWQVFEPNLGYYIDLLLYPLARSINGRSLLISALLLVAQSASAAGIFAEWLLDRRDHGKRVQPVHD
jgi:glycosyltransferase involved in cell wall biosynthesis